jgi:hypothetical protein
MKLIINSIINNINKHNLVYDRIFRSYFPKCYAIWILFAFFEVPSIP